MRNPDRIDEILQQIKTIWNKYPDLRFGQLVYDIYATLGRNMFYMEDDELKDLLENFDF